MNGYSNSLDNTIALNSEEESYIVLFKLATYRYDASSGPDGVNKPITWISYPAVSLTATGKQILSLI